MRKTLLVLLSLLVCASNAFAWGQEGHRIVCRIAFDLLSPDEQKTVDELARGYKLPPDAELQIESFPDGCVFADEARAKGRDAAKAGLTDSPWLHFQQFDNQHFINVGRDTKTITEEMCHDDCVLSGIASQSKLLKSATTDQERAEALIFLGHFVGDVHQPLHVSFADDQGGNLVRPVTGGFYPIPKKRPNETKEPELNLHSVWDGQILRKAITQSGWKAFADRLRKKITEETQTKWTAAPPLQWAQESFELTTSKDLQYCKESEGECKPFGHGRKLTEKYQHEFIGPVDQRLEAAGVRLAALIHEALSQ